MLAKLRALCNSRLRLHLFRRKEVTLIFLCNFFMAVVSFLVYTPSKAASIKSIVTSIAVTVSFPILGCLADNFFSRYKIVSGSWKLIWVTSVVDCAVSIAFYVQGIKCEDVDSLSTCGSVDLAFKVILSFGIGGFIVNIGQLSMDQLHDASSNEVIAFFVWYFWTWSLAGMVVMLSHTCFHASFKLADDLLLCVSASCVLCLDFLFNHWLVKEPPSKSPFKLFLGVLRYVLKNKQPRLRSAFTYWDNKKYTRIDLAKSKYGGPYTTEEVEDVKTFLRMLVVIAFATFVAGAYTVVSKYSQNLKYHFQDSFRDNQKHCFFDWLMIGFAYLLITIFVPFHEFILYPFFWKFILQINSAFKFNLFLAFFILSFLVTFILEVIGYEKLPEDLKANLTCVLTEGQPPVALPLTYKWIYIAKMFNGFGVFYLASSFAEFICANSPYSLKGLAFGYLFVLYSLSTVLCGFLLFPLDLKAKTWNSVVLGCGAWFSLSVIVVFVAFLIFQLTIVKKLYKTRRRDEDIHNRHIFAINYYSRYVKYNQELENSYE